MSRWFVNVPNITCKEFVNIPNFISEKFVNVPNIMSQKFVNVPTIMSQKFINIPNIMSQKFVNIPNIMSQKFVNIPNIMSQKFFNVLNIMEGVYYGGGVLWRGWGGGGALALVVRASGLRIGRPRVLSSAGSVCCFLEQRNIYSPKVLVIPRNRWLRLNMTEKLFTGTLNINKKKKKKNIL